MVAVPLIFGRLTTEDYSDEVAADPRIDALREKVRLRRQLSRPCRKMLILSCAVQMECVEDEFFSTDYHNPESRSIGNALTVTLNDGTVLNEVEILYPVGHKRCVSFHTRLPYEDESLTLSSSCSTDVARKVHLSSRPSSSDT